MRQRANIPAGVSGEAACGGAGGAAGFYNSITIAAAFFWLANKQCI